LISWRKLSLQGRELKVTGSIEHVRWLLVSGRALKELTGMSVKPFQLRKILISPATSNACSCPSNGNNSMMLPRSLSSKLQDSISANVMREHHALD